MNPIPRGWRIEAVDRGVYFEVPASGVDGVFQLTLAEAVSAGIALINAAELARRSNEATGSDDTHAPGLAEEAHRQSALAAGSSSAAEDQAWVDAISEFGDEDTESRPDAESGDQ